MKKTRFSEEQMVTILREADTKPVPDVAKKHGVSAQTIYSWRKHFCSLEPSDVKRLRQLEQENGPTVVAPVSLPSLIPFWTSYPPFGTCPRNRIKPTECARQQCRLGLTRKNTETNDELQLALFSSNDWSEESRQVTRSAGSRRPCRSDCGPPAPSTRRTAAGESRRCARGGSSTRSRCRRRNA